jgi:hypothetical protein
MADIVIAADTTPPSISITCPPTGQTYNSATISISGTALDDVAVNKLEVKAGTGAWKTAAGTTSWNISGLTLANGVNTVYAKATDTSGNVKETSITVTYDSTATGTCPSASASPIDPIATPTLPASSGTTYYASPSGSGSGTSASSPTTLMNAINKANPGDIVIALPGSYGGITVWPTGKSGTASAPITLKAMNRAVTIVNHNPATIVDSQRSKINLSLNRVHDIRIDGLYGTVHGNSGNLNRIELRNNYNIGGQTHNVFMTHTDTFIIHDSLIENYEWVSDGWLTDYGLMLYPGTNIVVYNNVFRGGFNHAISLKISVMDVTITGNRFINCGRHCIELGQQTDGKEPGKAAVDRTSKNILVKNNLFESTGELYNGHPSVNAAYALTIYNADDVTIESNEWRNFDTAILVSSLGPTYCSTYGEYLVQVPIKPDYTQLKGNRFVGATKVRIDGRGVIGDKVEISCMSGGPIAYEERNLPSFTCKPPGLACCAWDGDPETTAAPNVVYLSGSSTPPICTASATNPDPQPTTSLTLKPGWNQISSPIAEGISLATIESSCTILPYKSQKLWAWNGQTQMWINPAKVEPFKGYWIYAAYQCTVPLSGTHAAFTSLPLSAGWNKISAKGELNSIKRDCQIAGNWIWNWDKATEKWIHPTTMQLDKGYWIKVDQNCVLTS